MERIIMLDVDNSSSCAGTINEILLEMQEMSRGGRYLAQL